MSLTVKDLRDVLDNIPDDRPVYLSIDEEGNAFHCLYSVEECLFDTKDMEAIHPDDEEEWRTDPHVVNAVVLWP